MRSHRQTNEAKSMKIGFNTVIVGIMPCLKFPVLLSVVRQLILIIHQL
jgi:hypothetical protein